MERYDTRPFIAIWELTQACDLACQHCRACAQPRRNPEELDTAEGRGVLAQLAAAEVPLVVLTGGDPAKRPDLLELVAHGSQLGLNMALTVSATPLITETLLRQLKDAGLRRLAISLDGPTAAIHDSFRGASGSFDDSWRILETAQSLQMATQINTSVHSGTVFRLGEVAKLVRESGCVLWSVFFIVPTGRASVSMLPTPRRVESTLNELAELAETLPCAVKTTAAPQYRRVLAQRRKAKLAAPQQGTHGARALRVNDGRGFLFVNHLGDVFPSGFLPIPCGNVRERGLLDIYRNHPTFRELRDADKLQGRCGRCEYRQLCGGSRARAYAMSGSCAAEDPLCAYQPASVA